MTGLLTKIVKPQYKLKYKNNMTLIKKGNEIKNDIKLKGLIFGQAGVGKTTLALSAPDPLLFDFDKGFHRANELCIDNDVVQIIENDNTNGYETILKVLAEENLSPYKTIVIDTFGRLVESIEEYVLKNNPKLKNNRIQMYGAIKDEFKKFLKVLDKKDKAAVFVSHEKEDKSGDVVIKRLDVSGSSGTELVKILDYVGYASINGGKRTIDFMPNDSYYAKNSIGLESFIEIDDLRKTGKNDFLERVIFNGYKDRSIKQSELIEQYQSLISLIDANINELKTVEDVNQYMEDLPKLQHIWSSLLVGKNKLIKKSEELGFIFDQKTKKFIKATKTKND